MSEKLRSVTVRFCPEMFEQIRMISEKRGENTSDTVRYLISRGLDERIYQKNTDLIAGIVREQVEKALSSYALFSISPHSDLSRTPPKAVDPRRLSLCRKNKLILPVSC